MGCRLRESGTSDFVAHFRSNAERAAMIMRRSFKAASIRSAEVRRLTQGAGVDRVVEVGGGGTMNHSLRAMSLGAELALVGNVAGGSATVDLNASLAPTATVRRVAVGSRAQFISMARAISVNRMRPVIDRVFSFEEAPSAFAYYAEQKNFGKVVIRVSS